MEVKLNTDKWLFQTFNGQPNHQNIINNKEICNIKQIQSTYESHEQSSHYSSTNNNQQLHQNDNPYLLMDNKKYQTNNIKAYQNYHDYHQFKNKQQNYIQNKKQSQYSKSFHAKQHSPIKNTKQNMINSKYNQKHLMQASKRSQRSQVSIKSNRSNSKNKAQIISQIIHNINYKRKTQTQIQQHQYQQLSKSPINKNKEFKGLRQAIFDRQNRDKIDVQKQKLTFQSDLNNRSPIKKIEDKKKISLQKRKFVQNYQQSKNSLQDNSNNNNSIKSKKSLITSKYTQKQLEFMKSFCTQPLNIKSPPIKEKIIQCQNKQNFQNNFGLIKDNYGKPPKPKQLLKSPSAQNFVVRGVNSLDKNFKASSEMLLNSNRQKNNNGEKTSTLKNNHLKQSLNDQILNHKQQLIQNELISFRSYYQQEQRKLKHFYSQLQTKIQQLKIKQLRQMKRYQQQYQNKFKLCKDIIKKQKLFNQNKNKLQNDQCDRILKNVRNKQKLLKVSNKENIKFDGFLIILKDLQQKGIQLKKQYFQKQSGTHFSFDKMIQ